MKGKTFESRHSNPGASPGFLLWKAANLHQRLQRQELSELGISPTQFSLLASYFFLCGVQDGPVSQADVCDHASLDKMLVSDGTRALLRKKLIARKRSDTDGRAFAIELTASGVAICNRALQVVEAMDANFFAKTGDVTEFVRLTSRLLR